MPCRKLNGGILVVMIWPEFPSYLALLKSRIILPFWSQFTQGVLEYWPLNDSVCVCACGRRLTSTFVDGESAFIILISMVWGVASFDKINVNIQSAIVLNILHNKHCNIYYHLLTGTCYLTMTLPWKNSTMFHTDIPTCHSYYCTDLHCPLIMSIFFV